MNTNMGNFGVVLAMLALCILLGANVAQLVTAHSSLKQTIEHQKESEPTIAKINAQLDSLATSTQRLAAAGNSNASKIIATLAENGIKIKSSH